MEALIYLDTRVVVWLFTGEIPALSARACAAIESEDLRISPMAELEIDS